MDRSGLRPVGRRWFLQNPIFARPEPALRFRDTGFPDLTRYDGYLGDFLLLDTERAALGGLSLWEDEEAELRSRAYLIEAASAPFGTDAAQEIAVTTFGVRYSHFNFGPGGRPVLPALDSVVAWSVGFHGESMLDPGVQSVLATYASEYLVQAPGCLGVLMMVHEDDARLAMQTFWTDETSAERATEGAQDSVRSITSSARSTATPINRLQALVFDPIHRRIG